MPSRMTARAVARSSVAMGNGGGAPISAREASLMGREIGRNLCQTKGGRIRGGHASSSDITDRGAAGGAAGLGRRGLGRGAAQLAPLVRGAVVPARAARRGQEAELC